LASRPVILVSPHTEAEGQELADPAVSLSRAYADALLQAGGLPLVLPCQNGVAPIREAVSLSDGILLSGGDDVDPALYSAGPLSSELAAKLVLAVGGRDLFELILIEEAFRQRKPLLAICRGHQIVNVALGGDLIVDLAAQSPGALPHDRQSEHRVPVHDIAIEPDSRLARIAGGATLAVNSTHHQAVGRIAPPLRPVARASDGVVEALELREDHLDALPFFLSVQFHPERLSPNHPAHAAIFTDFVGACAATRAEG
jgi:putative glutamine amidotransferase